jgi:hypothetical protein
VLSHCLWLNPQIWVGTFWDAVEPTYQMWSIASPDVSKDEMIAKLRELHALEVSTRVAKTRSSPLLKVRLGTGHRHWSCQTVMPDN